MPTYRKKGRKLNISYENLLLKILYKYQKKKQTWKNILLFRVIQSVKNGCRQRFFSYKPYKELTGNLNNGEDYFGELGINANNKECSEG
jgi:hypothetical protein